LGAGSFGKRVGGWPVFGAFDETTFAVRDASGKLGHPEVFFRDGFDDRGELAEFIVAANSANANTEKAGVAISSLDDEEGPLRNASINRSLPVS
jgi:hypothetical protein